jgi:hypothetical protein
MIKHADEKPFIRQFIMDHYDFNDAEINRSDLWRHYRDHSRANGKHPISVKELMTIVGRTFTITYRRDRKGNTFVKGLRRL